MRDPVLTVSEVAEFLRVNERVVYRLAQKGEIPAFKVGGSWRFQRSAIEQWIRDRSEQNKRLPPVGTKVE